MQSEASFTGLTKDWTSTTPSPAHTLFKIHFILTSYQKLDFLSRLFTSGFPPKNLTCIFLLSFLCYKALPVQPLLFDHLLTRVAVRSDAVLLPFDCWDCGFEYRWGHGCFYLSFFMRVVQVVASATSWSLVRRSPTGCVSNCVWSRSLTTEAAWSGVGLLRYRKKK